MEVKDFFGAFIAIVAILANFLIFAISWWIVLIIDVIAFIILNAAFNDIESSPWLYFVEGVICIIFMVLLMCFPEKVCGGMLSDTSNAKSVASIAGSLGLDTWNQRFTVAEVTKRFHTIVGIVSTVYIACLIITGLIFCVKHSKGDVDYYGFYLSIPLSCLFGLVFLSSPLHIMMSMWLGAIWGVIMMFIAIIGLIVSNSEDDGGGSGGSGGSDTYHVIIFKD